MLGPRPTSFYQNKQNGANQILDTSRETSRDTSRYSSRDKGRDTSRDSNRDTGGPFGAFRSEFVSAPHRAQTQSGLIVRRLCVSADQQPLFPNRTVPSMPAQLECLSSDDEPPLPPPPLPPPPDEVVVDLVLALPVPPELPARRVRVPPIRVANKVPCGKGRHGTASERHLVCSRMREGKVGADFCLYFSLGWSTMCNLHIALPPHAQPTTAHPFVAIVTGCDRTWIA
jgi:hypothetical protein